MLADGDKAFALLDLTGPVVAGDRVVVNTTAVELGLGSGGAHIVHWNLTCGVWSHPGPGHLMKLRYTSLQVDTGAGEEDGEVPSDLGGIPVVVAGVHSQLPAVAAASARDRPGTRVAYVMTDGAALPLAMSDLVANLVASGLLVGSVTAGHAFGGDVEALNVPSALALARHRLDAEVIVVAMGPCIVGTGQPARFHRARGRAGALEPPPPGSVGCPSCVCAVPMATPGPVTKALATTAAPCSTRALRGHRGHPSRHNPI